MALAYLLSPTFEIVNSAGKPATGGYIETYVAGSRTKYLCASDFDGTRHPFRIPLDSLGSNVVLADDSGSYDVYVYNRYGTLLMSRYNVHPGEGGGLGGGNITSSDGSIIVTPTANGNDLKVNIGEPSVLRAGADTIYSSGPFVFSELVREGDKVWVDELGKIRCRVGWYHYDITVRITWAPESPRNETIPVQLYTTLASNLTDFDASYTHDNTIRLSGETKIVENGAELAFGVIGLRNGLGAELIDMGVHAICIGTAGQSDLSAGTGIVINQGEISVDPMYMSSYATQAELTYGLAGKQDVISDLSTIRSGAEAGSTAIQPSDLAAVATTGDYDDLIDKPDLSVYATTSAMNTALAGKQDTLTAGSNIAISNNVISATVDPQVQADWAENDSSSPAYIKHRPDLDTYATDVELAAGLATKQDVLTPGDNITISNNVISATDQRQADWSQSDSSAVDYIRNKPDLSTYATDAELAAGLSTKQDTINDLSTIRSGAAAGASAVQPSDLAPVATSGDYDDLSDKPDLSVYATTSAMNTALASKQDTISDLSTIRSGAAAGATAIQPGDLATVATTGSYDDLSNKPDLSVYAETADLATVATTGDYDELVNKPDLSVYAETSDLATVATTGDYDDLVNKPTIPSFDSAQMAAINSGVNSTKVGNYDSHIADTTIHVTSTDKTNWNAKENASNKAQTLDPTSTTEFPSSAAAANFVNSSVATATANFLGNYDLTDLGLTYPATTSQIETALDGYTFATTPTNNDYVYVEVQNPQTTGIDDEVQRYKFNGTSWLYEYTLNNSSFTTAEKAAIDSGIDSAKVAVYDAHVANTDIHVTTSDKSSWNAKQDAISDLATIRSGAAAGASAVQPGDLAVVATTGSYDSLSNKPTINNVPVVTSSDNDKVLKASYSGGVGSYSWQTEQGGSTYTAGDAIEIDNDEISVLYDSDTMELKSGSVTVHEDVDTFAGSYPQDNCGRLSFDLAQVLGHLSVTVHIPGDTFKTWYVGNDSAVLMFKRYMGDAPTSNNVAWCPTPLSVTQDTGTGQFVVDEQDVIVSTLTGPGANITLEYFCIGLVNGDIQNGNTLMPETNDLTEPVEFEYTYASGTTELAVKNPLPASAIGDATKVLTVDNTGAPVWATAQAPISAGTGIDITNNVVSVDTSVVATQTDLASKQDTISDLATIRSGAAEGATAVQPGDLATVATTGSYDDLVDKPTIPAAQVNSDWNSNSGVSQILNKPTLATVATTGDYDDLSNKPSIPAAQVNSDWNAVSGVSEILNKPSLATVATTGSYTDLSNKPDLSVYAESADLATVATTGDYTDLSNTPTIPSGTQLVPVATSADADKVLTVNSQGTPEWATGGGTQVQSDWTEADTSAPSYIENKPVPKTLTAGTGISITENQSTITIANTATPPTVDQTYDASSTNAQSGVAVAEAIAALGTWTDVSSEITKSTTIITGGSITFRYNAILKLISLIGEIHVQGDGDVYALPEKYRPQTNFTCANPGATSYIDYTPSTGKFVARSGANGYFSWTMTMPCLGE